MKFAVTVLGSNSAIPTLNRNPSGQVLNVNESFYLIDCGEGTQVQLRRFKIKFQRLEAIFISHLHGDHYFGLIGLLTTMHLLRREKPLTLVCPPELKEILELQLEVAGTELSYPITYNFFTPEDGKVIYEDRKLKVSSVKLSHRIACSGFVFEEKSTPPNIQKNAIDRFQLSVAEIKALKEGEKVVRNGENIAKEALEPQPSTRKYAYVTDTKKLERIVPFLAYADLLYHEATFLHEEKEKAKKTFHTTALQAAEQAKAAEVKKLMLGHFSTRYKTSEALVEEAETVFSPTIAAEEGLVVEM